MSVPISVPSDTAVAGNGLAADRLIARMERLPWTRKHWAIAASLCTATGFDGYDTGVIRTGLPLLLVAFNLPLDLAGVVASAAFWGQAIGSPLSGIAAERWGRRTVLLISCAIMGATAVLSTMAQDFNQLLAARAIQGLGMGAEIPIAGAMFSEFVRGKHRGAVIYSYESIFSWGIQAVAPVALISIALLGQQQAWRGMFAVSILPLFLIFVRPRVLPESPRWLISKGRLNEAEKIVVDFENNARSHGQALPEPMVVAQPQQKPSSLRELMSPEYRTRTLALLAWVALGDGWVNGLGVLMSAMYVSLGGLTPAQAITVALATQWIGTAYFYVVALLLDRLGRKIMFGWTMVGSGIVLVVAALVAGLLGYHSWPFLLVTTQLVGFGALSAAGVFVYVPELYPTRMRAWATSVALTAIRLVSATMPLLMGVILASSFGLGGAFGLTAVFLVLGGLTVVKWLPETRGRTLEEIAA